MHTITLPLSTRARAEYVRNRQRPTSLKLAMISCTCVHIRVRVVSVFYAVKACSVVVYQAHLQYLGTNGTITRTRLACYLYEHERYVQVRALYRFGYSTSTGVMHKYFNKILRCTLLHILHCEFYDSITTAEVHLIAFHCSMRVTETHCPRTV